MGGSSTAGPRPTPRAALAAPLRRALRLLVTLAGQGHAELYMVGGSVRDLLLGRRPLDLDLMTTGDAIRLGREYVRLHGGHLTAHPRVGTAAISLAGGERVDLASPRRERYQAAGELPEVEGAEVAEDLRRRDFSINAMAWQWRRKGPGPFLDPFHGHSDLRRRWVRILHPASFEDDPTRGFRAVRLASRLGFRLERGTASALRQAIDRGLIGSLTAARQGRELRLLALEGDWPVAATRTARAGLLQAIHPGLVPPSLPACRRVQRALAGRSPDETLPVVLACFAMEGDGPPLSGALDRLQVRGGSCRRARRLLTAARTLRHRLDHLPPTQITLPLLARDALEISDDALLLAAGTAPAAAVRRILETFRHRRRDLVLGITAADLLAAGVPRGPELALRLVAVRRALLSGRPGGRRSELEYALSAPAVNAESRRRGGGVI